MNRFVIAADISGFTLKEPCRKFLEIYGTEIQNSYLGTCPMDLTVEPWLARFAPSEKRTGYVHLPDCHDLSEKFARTEFSRVIPRLQFTAHQSNFTMVCKLQPTPYREGNEASVDFQNTTQESG